MLCRLGVFPELFPNVQVANDAETLNQFQRSWTPYTVSLTIICVQKYWHSFLIKSVESILVTHSMGGSIGWRTPFHTKNVKAIVAFEPGGTPFVFPENELPESIPTTYAPVAAQAEEVPLEKFKKLTQMPIILYYGDNIASKQTNVIGPDKWRSEMAMARKFVETINRHGGRAELVHLPDIGIFGNTHFLMSDLNNEEIANLMKIG